MTILLNNTGNPISRDERNKINENWQRIIDGLTNLQMQIKVLAGGHEVDELIARLEQAIVNAETDLQNYIEQINSTVQDAIDKNNTATQQAIDKNNAALQASLGEVSDKLQDLSTAITNAETATTDTTNAKNSAIQATQDAQNAISNMQSVIDNTVHRGEWNSETQYFKNNMAVYNGSTFISLQDNLNKVPPTLPTQSNAYWSLFAEKGDKGSKGDKGDTGAALSILGKLTDPSQLPPTGQAGQAYTVNGVLFVWSENTNSWENVGNIKGEKGDTGANGEDGLSAYEVAVNNGFVGTLTEWLASLKGEKGDKGQDANLTEVNQEIANIKQTVTDNKAEVTEHLGQLEQTTENHIIDSTKHLLDGERNKINKALQPSTYNASNTIVNIGANRATRVFPQINWAAPGIELWETSFFLPKSVWGMLELDIAGFSTMAGAKIVVEIGVSVPASGDSVLYKNVLKVVTSATEFTENFYVEVEHRASVKGIYIKVFKRTHNDPLNVTATFTSMSNSSTLSAFDFLKGFSNGALYTSIASVPALRQKDFDARITENFTSASDVKTNVAAAITEQGVPTSPTATGAQMAANIRAISKGVKSASGYINVPGIAPNGTATVQTPVLDFEPKNSSFGLPGAQLVQGSAYNFETTITNWRYVTKIDIIPSGSKWIVQFTVKNGYPTTMSAESFRYNITN